MKTRLYCSLLALTGTAHAGDALTTNPQPLPTDAEVSTAVLGDPSWITGEDVTFFDGVLTPHLHIIGAAGATTADSLSDLALTHHDPQDDLTLQALEAGLSLRAGQIQGFVNYSAYTDAEGTLDGELEEGFLKIVELPFNTEVRGGQFLNRFGFQNAVHNHAWSFVDQNLINGRFLNEGELTTQGGEITFNLPARWGNSALSLSYGGTPSHSHDHGEEGHDHGEEAEFEAEGVNFNNWVAGANLVTRFDYDDFNQYTGTVSGAWGENEFGLTSQVYGLGFQYQWRENGVEPGGRYFRWRTEVMYRDVEAMSGHGHGHGHEEEHGHEDEHGHHDEDEHHDEEEHGHHDEDEDDHHDEEEHHDEDDERPRRGSFDEFGFYTMLAYGWDNNLETSIRGEWVSGIDALGLDDRWRVSPAITYYLNQSRTSHLRLQYNYDRSDYFGDEHSVAFQFSWGWGGAEVR